MFKFNFTKIFAVDRETNGAQRKRMQRVLRSGDAADSDLVFSVVNEPADGSECYEVGIAEINLLRLIELKEDVVNEELPVVDEHDVEIGSLFVTVLALDTIKALM